MPTACRILSRRATAVVSRTRHKSSFIAPASSPSAPPPGFPRLPLLGSLPWFSNLSLPDGSSVQSLDEQHESWAEGTRRHGPVWRVGIPGLGKGISGDLTLCADPREFVKVLQAEGKYPYGAIQLQWPFIVWATKHGRTVGKLFTRSEDWRHIRHGMQKSILPPAAAAGYAAIIGTTGREVVLNAPLWDDAGAFMSRASFDLFAGLALGRRIRASDPRPGASLPEDERFCVDTIEALDLLPDVIQDLPSIAMSSLGLESPMMKRYFRAVSGALDYAEAQVREMLARLDAAEPLSTAEEASYLASTVRTQRAAAAAGAADALTDDEIVASVSVALVASVDTTSSIATWVLAHLAREPDVQQRLREEVAAALQQHAGSLAAVIEEELPYLKAVVRETHRLTPALVISSVKEVDADIDLAGHRIPAGSLVALENHSLQMSEALVEQPRAFRPERWLAGAVAERKGTPAELIDHPLLSAPFSAGARKCPGSRVATLEVRALIAGLVHNWRIGLVDERQATVPYRCQTTIAPTMPRLRYEPLTEESRAVAEGLPPRGGGGVCAP